MARPRKTPSRARAGAARRRASRTEGEMPPVVYAQASPRSLGGVSMFEAGAQITEETAIQFASDPSVIVNAVERLQNAGFQVLHYTHQLVNIAGSANLYERVFGTTLTTEERPVVKELGKADTATFIDSPDTTLPGLIDTSESQLADVLEGVAIEEPRYLHQNAFAPLQTYWHLRVPGDVSLAANADRAHRAGITGRGVKVVMTDTGWFRHPYFVQRGYRSSPVVLGPAAANPNADEHGHGTGESANVFAVAPDVDFTMVKLNFVNTIGAFNAAVGLSPHIISNSWGSSKQNPPLSAADQALAAVIALAVSQGIIVVFSAGNGHFGFPGQHPDVISAGGAFMEANGTFRASNYSSGFASAIYPGRNVPDVCGLVGMTPRAIYIMLPVQPNDTLDQSLAGGTHPNGDQTATNDGWAAFSGTSAAAPQLAGACALIKQACPRLTPAEVRAILRSTARDVTSGTCSAATGGHRAVAGHDLATGTGLVDATRAALVARVRCLGPIKPITVQPPIQPITVRPPIQPPISPPILPPISPPIAPPIQPPITVRPPIVPPIQPPIEPVLPPTPAGSAEEIAAAEAPVAAGEEALTADEVTALEELIIESDADVEL
jgi:subtilisin family serine protease